MDGYILVRGIPVTVCAGFIPQGFKPAQGIIALHPAVSGGRFRSPQDPLPSAAVDPFTEQT
jgi:hypothetical protein